MEAYPNNDVLFFIEGTDGEMHPVTNCGREIEGFVRGYNQAKKDILEFLSEVHSSLDQMPMVNHLVTAAKACGTATIDNIIEFVCEL